MQGDSRLGPTAWYLSTLQIQRPAWGLVIECTDPAPPYSTRISASTKNLVAQFNTISLP